MAKALRHVIVNLTISSKTCLFKQKLYVIASDVWFLWITEKNNFEYVTHFHLETWKLLYLDPDYYSGSIIIIDICGRFHLSNDIVWKTIIITFKKCQEIWTVLILNLDTTKYQLKNTENSLFELSQKNFWHFLKVSFLCWENLISILFCLDSQDHQV
jgi:hypothetical protein